MTRSPMVATACLVATALWASTRPGSQCVAADAPPTQGKEQAKYEQLLSQTPDVPEHVVYKKASGEVNRRALDMLSSRPLLAGERAYASDQVFSDKLICGPGLWPKIKDDPDMKKITKGEVKFKIPTKNGEQELAGKLFQTNDEVAAFWKAFRRAYKSEEATVRRPSREELRIYWAMISFDIEEPLFVVETKSASILVQFVSSPSGNASESKELRIFWIDDYKDVHLRK
jgi:hypothetical protein